MPENSGEFPSFPDGDPNAQTRGFDAFNPPPSPADPGGAGHPGAGQLPPADPPYFAYPPTGDPAAAAARGARPRSRSLAVIGGVVLLVCAIGAGAYAAFGSSSPGQPAAAASGPTAGATKAAHKRKEQAARLTITSFNGNTLVGTTAAGASVTVDITTQTKLGTKAHPLSSSQLTVGQVVIVRGDRAGDGTYTATEIAMAPSGAPGGAAPSGAPAATPTPSGPSA